MNKPIGVFDSGVGGLTVVRELIRELPGEDIIYFGDTARVPYGAKSKSTILRFSLENVLYLLKFNVQLIVIACNSSSAVALEQLRSHFRVPILGVIEPGARSAIARTRSKRIGVIGTSATISSRAYEKALAELSLETKVFSQSCPLFVPLVEEGWTNNEVAFKAARQYLAPLKEKNIDTLILGCTHYPLLKSVIGKIMGDDIALVDSSVELAKEAKALLDRDAAHKKKKGRCGRLEFYVSDEPAKFAQLGRRFLGGKIETVKRAKNNV